MGFGIELGKTVAKTGANMLTGGLVNGIMGLFGGSNKAEQRKYEHEKEMMALQNKYNTKAAAQSMEYAKTMNRINFEQQNQMFDKQAEWNSQDCQIQTSTSWCIFYHDSICDYYVFLCGLCK